MKIERVEVEDVAEFRAIAEKVGPSNLLHVKCKGNRWTPEMLQELSNIFETIADWEPESAAILTLEGTDVHIEALGSMSEQELRENMKNHQNISNLFRDELNRRGEGN